MKSSNNPTNKKDLRGMTLRQLEEFLPALEIPASRAQDLYQWLYQEGPYQLDSCPILKKVYRQKLAQVAYVSTLSLQSVRCSEDGTRKFLLGLADGCTIECVLIPADGRWTLCLSSQVGCAMGCRFCLTGTMGLKRNLIAAEIVNQVVTVVGYMIDKKMTSAPFRECINNLVFMGMGEPLANYHHLIQALHILMEPRGLEFTERRVTVSTCGLVPRIVDLGRDVQVNLAVSLHAADDETRSALMPVNESYAQEELLAACRDYPLRKRKVILFEYTLIHEINDSDAAAALLAERLRGIPCRINLMPFNACAQLPYKAPGQGRVKSFQKILCDAGYRTLVRKSRGADIAAACGQLALQHDEEEGNDE